jgi:NCS1 family nucleobase:cation symporter-1
MELGWGGLFGIWATVGFSMSNFQLVSMLRNEVRVSRSNTDVFRFDQGAALLSFGLNWWQTIVATLFGHILGAVVVVIMSYPGLEYYISFPVAMRVAWGKLGYHHGD